MKVVYLASPYSANTDWDKWCNIRNAHKAAKEIWQHNMACLSPCSNTAFMGGDIKEQIFLDGDIEMLKRCDAIFMNEGWSKSNGCIAEKSYAISNDIPIFDNIEY